MLFENYSNKFLHFQGKLSHQKHLERSIFAENKDKSPFNNRHSSYF